MTYGKLGKLDPVKDSRNLQLIHYLTADLPDPPDQLIQTTQLQGWGMMGNDTHGCCTCAALAHMTQLWGAGTPTTDDVLALYSLVNGGVDGGAAMLEVLRVWKKHHFPTVPKEYDYAYVHINPRNHKALKQAMALFGGVYLGVALPTDAQNETGPGQVWQDHTGQPGGDAGGWGGHAINLVNYSQDKLDVITWGFLQSLTWDFLDAYGDEAYAIIPETMAKKPPKGFDVKQLKSDLESLKG